MCLYVLISVQLEANINIRWLPPLIFTIYLFFDNFTHVHTAVYYSVSHPCKHSYHLFLRQGLTEPGVQWFDLSSWPDSFEDLPGIFPHLSNSATPSFYLGSGESLYPG